MRTAKIATDSGHCRKCGAPIGKGELIFLDATGQEYCPGCFFGLLPWLRLQAVLNAAGQFERQ